MATGETVEILRQTIIDTCNKPAPTRVEQTEGVSPVAYYEREIRELLRLADVEVGGCRPWDIQTLNARWFHATYASGTLGLGEAYVRGWWETERLDEFFYKIISAGLENKVRKFRHLRLSLQAKLFNLQARTRALRSIAQHYDRGNEFYRHMLDKRMVYSCAYWNGATTRAQAQENKLHLICRKIGLQRGQRVLDVGCGWGSFPRFAAENYGAEVVGITLSREQAELANKMCKGLPVQIRVQDYRDLAERFDHVVCIGMFEHVGHKNYASFFETIRNCLRDGGLLLLHPIGKNATCSGVDPWIAKYIFPDGELPSLSQISEAIEQHYVVEDVHNFGADYDKTLMAWFQNFDAAWPNFKRHYGDEFYRMWKYYLLSCAGSFRARDMQLYQLVLSTKGVKGGYHRPNLDDENDAVTERKTASHLAAC